MDLNTVQYVINILMIFMKASKHILQAADIPKAETHLLPENWKKNYTS